MNLFSDYKKKIFASLKNLKKKKIIQIPLKIKSFTVELPPKNQKADISCNAAMILAKSNNLSPKDLLTPSALITLAPNLGPGGI